MHTEKGTQGEDASAANSGECKLPRFAVVTVTVDAVIVLKDPCLVRLMREKAENTSSPIPTAIMFDG